VSIDRIVVGVDGSEGSGRGMAVAIDLAGPLGAEVIAVHAFEPLSYVGKVEPPLDFARIKDDTEKLLRAEWCKPLADAGIEFSTVVIDEDPVHALVDVAASQDADLIVIGTRGIGGVRGKVLGSVAAKVPHHTKLPIVIVPPD
jgi:nucleotide-binding universal stress UspA family protein